jgi:hypothetical protein
MALPEDIAALAEKIVNTLTHTVYQHVDKIDPASGVYDCDCNGFVAHLLRTVAQGPAKASLRLEGLDRMMNWHQRHEECTVTGFLARSGKFYKDEV